MTLAPGVPPLPTLCASFQANAVAGGDRPALLMAGHQGISWREYADGVRRLAPGFATLGARPGVPVGLLMGPRPEFHVVDTALLHAGAVLFSLAIADGKRYVTALIALDPDELGALAREHGWPGDFARWAAEPVVHDTIAAAVATANATLSRPETVRAFRVVDRPWRPGGDELTPTAKLRRAEIDRRYAADIDALYT